MQTPYGLPTESMLRLVRTLTASSIVRKYRRCRHIPTCELSVVVCFSTRVRPPQYGEKPNSAIPNHVRVPLLVGISELRCPKVCHSHEAGYE